jgi:hypothetical protein
MALLVWPSAAEPEVERWNECDVAAYVSDGLVPNKRDVYNLIHDNKTDNRRTTCALMTPVGGA